MTLLLADNYNVNIVQASSSPAMHAAPQPCALPQIGPKLLTLSDMIGHYEINPDTLDTVGRCAVFDGMMLQRYTPHGNIAHRVYSKVHRVAHRTASARDPFRFGTTATEHCRLVMVRVRLCVCASVSASRAGLG